MQRDGAIFVSFYTDNYAQHGEALRRSLDKWKLEHDVRRVERPGNWLATVRWKPQFIRDMVNKYQEKKAVIWIDADARVVQQPSELLALLGTDCDIACRFIEWKKKIWAEIHMGLLYLRNSALMNVLMNEWVDRVVRIPKDERCPEQEAFYQLLLEQTKRWKIWTIPEHYCHVVRESEKWAVVTQFQQSRYEREPEKMKALKAGKGGFGRHNWKQDFRLNRDGIRRNVDATKAQKALQRAKNREAKRQRKIDAGLA